MSLWAHGFGPGRSLRHYSQGLERLALREVERGEVRRMMPLVWGLAALR